MGTIPNNSSGLSHGDNFIEGSLDKGDLMRAGRIRVQGDWKTGSVCNNHELRTQQTRIFWTLRSDLRHPDYPTGSAPSQPTAISTTKTGVRLIGADKVANSSGSMVER